MNYLRQTSVIIGAAGILAVAGSVPAMAAQSGSTPPPRSGMRFPAPALDDRVANEGVIEDAAVQALKDMSNYLMQAKTLQISTQGSLDVVTGDGQRIQLDGVTTYKVRRPGFVIDYTSDMKSRRFIYDGKSFTVYSP